MTTSPPTKLTWTKDWFIKLVSVLFAIFLWYFVAGEDRVNMTIQIPVEIVNLPRNLIISNQFKNQLEVTVSGPRGMIKKISSQGINRSIDLSNASSGNVVIRNDPDSISMPRGIRVLQIHPTHIILLLDQLIQRELPIKHTTMGTIPEDYELVSVKLDPPTIILSGPQEILGHETFIHTNPIDLSELTSSTIKQISLDLSPEVADLIGEPIITAKVTIQEKITEKNISKIPLLVEGLPPESYSPPAPKMVKIRASLPLPIIRQNQDLRQLFTAVVNAASLPPGSHEIKVEIRTTAPKTDIIEILPDTVTLIVKEIPPIDAALIPASTTETKPEIPAPNK